MNRIGELLTKKDKILSVYLTAGYPNLGDTVPILVELEKAGVDMVEIGMPFSDPVADGPTIQRSSEIALKNGMKVSVLLGYLKNIRSKVSLPLVLMGYINPILQFGVDRFCAAAKEVGIDGLILPDLPFEEYIKSFKRVFQDHGLKNVSLVTSRTSEERIRMIDSESDSFIYAVSMAGTTGKTLSVDTEVQEYLQRLKSMKLKNPVVVGFGIADRESFELACSVAKGGIVGSAFVRAISEGDFKKTIPQFVRSFR